MYRSVEFMADAKIKQVIRDVKERGRDIEGCIKQWTAYVKPNFERYVQPQRKSAGLWTIPYDWPAAKDLMEYRYYRAERNAKSCCY